MAQFTAKYKDAQAQQPQQQERPGFLRTLGQEIAEPFAKIAVTGEKGLSQLLLGKNVTQGADYSRNVLGKRVEPAKTATEFAGAVLEAGSNFIPVGAGAKAVGTVARAGLRTTGLKSLLKTAGQSAGLTGLAGGIGAAGEAIQEPDMTAGQIAGRTAIGAGFGAGIGLAAPLIGRGIQQVAARRGGKAAQEAERAISATKLETKIPKAKQQLQERLPQNTALRNKVRQNTGVDVEDLIIEEGIPFGVKGDNLFDFSEAIEDVIPTRKQGLGNALESLLGTVQKKGNLDEVQRLAIREVRNAPKGTYKLRQDEIISKIKRIIDREKKSYGTTTGYDILNKIKSAGYDKWDGASADARAGQAISKVIKDLIEREFADGSTQSNVIRTINRRYGNLINLENYLKKVDNRTVRGGKLGKKLNQTIGAIAGSQGGFIGSLLGSELAGRITDAVVDPTRITKSILDDMIRSGYVPPSIKAINEAKDYVLQNQADLVRKLINPETKLLQEGVPQPIQLPSEGILRGQRNIGNFNRPVVGKTVARNEEAFGALGGLEVYTDENGEKKLRFSPEKAAVGVGLMAGAKSDVGKKAIGKLKGVSDDLIKEARKYKSAEEFVKGQNISHVKTGEPIVVKGYHGTPDGRFLEEFDPTKQGYYPDSPEMLPDMKEWESLYGKPSQGFSIDEGVYTGISFSDDYRVAKSYSEKPSFDYQNSIPMVVERQIVLNNPKVIDATGDKMWEIGLENIVRQAKKDGYDGVVFKNIRDNYHPGTTISPSNNVVIFDANQIKTKSQLEQIWKEANKTKVSVSDDLIKEARKYKSAEEFVKAQTKPHYINIEDIKSSFDADTFSNLKGTPRNENINFLSEYKSTMKRVEKSPVGREIKKPISVQFNVDGGDGYRILDGNHRYLQALKNGDKKILVKFDTLKGTSQEGKNIFQNKTKSQLEQIWKEANKK